MFGCDWQPGWSGSDQRGLYEGELLHFVGSAPLRGVDGKKLAAIIADAIEPPGFTGGLPCQVMTQFGHRIAAAGMP